MLRGLPATSGLSTIQDMSEQMAELLRDTIRKSGISANQLARETGLTQPSISAFLNGAGISLTTAQKLADHFSLVLVRQVGKKRPAN